MRFVVASLLWITASLANAASIPMYDLPLKSGPAGSVYRMADHPNAVFVFEAYQLSCVYCNSNAVNVDQLATTYANNPRVQVLDLGLDTSDDAFAQWIARHNPNHPVVQDTGYRIYRALKTQNAIPQVFVVNCRGELIGSHVGAWDSSAMASIHSYINQGLAVTCQ